MDIAVIWSLANIGHVIKVIYLHSKLFRRLHKNGSDWPKGMREELDNVQNFGAGPITSLDQCFGENLVIFCKLSTLINVTNGGSHPNHLDDSTFNYRGI